MPGAWSGGLVVVLALLLVLCGRAAGQYDYQWRNGRATYYGADAWSIHKGNCGFGYISQDQPAGWDVAALSDKFPGFYGSCGRCYEVKCNPAVIHDGYGTTFDRTGVCYNTSTSLLVRVVDSCPCSYPANAYSNKRWCCGDMDHMDMAVWALEKLADKKWGVIGIQFRAVPCSFRPANPAPPAAHPTPGEHWSSAPPSFIQTGDMKTPKTWGDPQQSQTMVQGWQFGDPTGSSSSPMPSTAASASASASASSSAVSAVSSSSTSSSSTSASASAMAFASGTAQAAGTGGAWAAAGSGSGSGSGGASVGMLAQAIGIAGSQRSAPPAGSASGHNSSAGAEAATASGGTSKWTIFLSGLQNGWYDASYSATVNWRAGSFGADGDEVVCADITSFGALAVQHLPGAFVGATGLEWRMKTDSGSRPAIFVNIRGSSTACSPVMLSDLSVQDSRGNWSRFSMHLGDFGGSYTSFSGCGGASTGELATVEFKSTSAQKQTVCLDSLRLFSSSGSS